MEITGLTPLLSDQDWADIQAALDNGETVIINGEEIESID